jgi:hypothetical protein
VKKGKAKSGKREKMDERKNYSQNGNGRDREFKEKWGE